MTNPLRVRLASGTHQKRVKTSLIQPLNRFNFSIDRRMSIARSHRNRTMTQQLLNGGGTIADAPPVSATGLHSLEAVLLTPGTLAKFPGRVGTRTGRQVLMTRTILQLSLVVGFLIGLFCVFFSRLVQSIALKSCRNLVPGLRNPFLDWMKTAEYLWTVRVIGSILVTMIVFSELVFLFGEH